MYLDEVVFSNLNAVYNFGGYFSIPPGVDWVCAAHRFEQCKFYCITDGECVINVKGKDYHAKAGDWFFIPAGVEHSYYNNSEKHFSKYWMHFDIYPDVKIFTALELPYVVKSNSKILQLFKRFAIAKKSDRVTDRLIVKACVINLLSEYIKAANCDDVNVSGKSDERLDTVLRYINENLDKDISIEALSERYYCHPNHFIRIFKEKTGQTPAKYVKMKKFEAAKRLLEVTELSVSEIADRIAISDPTHFAKAFKSIYNMTPREYRVYYRSKLII